jgi:DNA-binding response OmpR family regulator
MDCPGFDEEEPMDGGRAGRLLLVEDEHLLRGLIAQFLRLERFEVCEAADGSEAIRLYSSGGSFDVVLLDLNLPLICGVEVCRRIKSLHPGQPVIICSAAILDSHIAALREMQVEQFLSKPYHPVELLSRIQDELSRGRRAESIDRATSVRADRAGRHRSFGATLTPYPGQDSPLGLK